MSRTEKALFVVLFVVALMAYGWLGNWDYEDRVAALTPATAQEVQGE